MKTRNKLYNMLDDENGKYNEYTEEYEGNRQQHTDNRQHEEEEDSERSTERSRSNARSETRSEPTPSGSRAGKKTKKHKSSRKRQRSGEEERQSDNGNLSNLDLLNNLTNYFEGRFQEIKQENQAMCHKMSKKMKLTEHTFKKTGNRYQYNHSMDVAAKVEEAQEYLERKKPNVKRAKEALSEGMGIIDERNKDILVADTSEGGWDTVNEYKKRQIADNSDDDKKLRRADTDALRKREQKKKFEQELEAWKKLEGFLSGL